MAPAKLPFEKRRYFRVSRFCLVALVAALAGARFATAETPALKIAVAGSLTGSAAFYGVPIRDGVKLAVEEANAQRGSPRIELSFHDDRSTDDGAREIAGDITAGDALLTVGPSLTTSALASGLIYAEAGLASILPAAHGDAVTDNETTFRSIFSTKEMGEALANYLHYVLDGKRAVLIFSNNGFGRPIAAGFKQRAERLGIEAVYRGFSTPAELDEAVRAATADPGQPAIVLGMLADQAVSALVTLRRQNAHGTILGPDSVAIEGLSELFADQPEYGQDRGFFTEGVYAISPAILDSANAETLAFASRFRERYGHEPSWPAVQGYDAARLAISAARAAARLPASDLHARRKGVLDYLTSRDSPGHAIAGLTGPLWFAADRGRIQAVRVGRFQGGLFESAPTQIVVVPNPDRAEIDAGTVIDLGSGIYGRRQQVVYSGIYLNEVSRVDIAQSRFTADFYLWLRYARGAGGGAADPAEIDFPDIVRGSSDGKVPAAQGNLDDGTTYRLWRMRGDFKNDFDLHRYPADRQTLAIRFFNARAASDRIVYVQDRLSVVPGLPPGAGNAQAASDGSARAAEAIPDRPGGGGPVDEFGGAAAPDAFRNLTQWEPLGVIQRRDNLVTGSALGDPRLLGVERVRELSGYILSIDLRRKVVATLAKTLLPLGLMSLIMYASLFFPVALVKEKVTVAITGALSGAVLLSSINSQLGGIGYIIAVEYGFYIFFGLCLLCIVAVLVAERLRVTGRQPAAATVERSGRYLFVIVCMSTALAAWLAFGRM
jgi:branched-chain amino acid transport system substrate-binding protein